MFLRSLWSGQELFGVLSIICWCQYFLTESSTGDASLLTVLQSRSEVERERIIGEKVARVLEEEMGEEEHQQCEEKTWRDQK